VGSFFYYLTYPLLQEREMEKNLAKINVGWVIRQLADGSPGKENKRGFEFTETKKILKKISTWVEK
jgi:hypothetical protein